jgi:uncharacterized protein YaiE (UPF0345 family)
MLQTSIDAASSFGSSQKRIDIQNEFVGNLTDSLKTGIGVMVDTDMEEASARLQALAGAAAARDPGAVDRQPAAAGSPVSVPLSASGRGV